MSILRSEVKSRVRITMRDRDPAHFAFSSPEVHRTIERNMRELAGACMLGQEWTTMNVTAASDLATFPGTQRYTQVLELRRQTDGEPVEIVSREEFESLRHGQPVTPLSPGRPYWCTLIEEPDQEMVGRFHPWPDATYVIELLRSTLPPVLATDDDSIPFDDQTAEALVLKVCADLVTTATKDQLERLKVTPNSVGRWDAAVAEFIRAQRQRHHSMRAAGRVRRTRRA